MRARFSLATLAFLVLAAPLAGQLSKLPQTYDGPPRAGFGITGLYAEPAGEFADYIERGWGLGGSFSYALDRAGWLAIRADLGFVNYGNESREVCISATVGCRVVLDLTTSNNIFYGRLGPELAVPVGPIRPYATLQAGLGYFGTTSSLQGDNGSEPFASTNNFDDAVLSWDAGGGIRIPVYSGRAPVAIDLAARYHRNGRVQYLREGDITDNPDGSITLDPQESQADLWTFHVGVRVGIRGG